MHPLYASWFIWDFLFSKKGTALASHAGRSSLMFYRLNIWPHVFSIASKCTWSGWGVIVACGWGLWQTARSDSFFEKKKKQLDQEVETWIWQSAVSKGHALQFSVNPGLPGLWEVAVLPHWFPCHTMLCKNIIEFNDFSYTTGINAIYPCIYPSLYLFSSCLSELTVSDLLLLSIWGASR